MTDFLQSRAVGDSPYERPSQAWRCGSNQQCLAGPSADGRCPKLELTCIPSRSISSQKRRILVFLLGGFLPLMILVLGSKSIFKILSPGPLSVGHSEVAACQDCHEAASESMSDWLHKAVKLNSNNDDKKCLNCHAYGENAFSPHSTSAVNLSNNHARQNQYFDADSGVSGSQQLNGWVPDMARKINLSHVSDGKDVSCSSCHREHQGKFEPLNGYESERCHGCHKVTFDDIEKEHPEYTQFPFVEPTRIRFDHVSHLQNYFFEDDYQAVAPEGCKQCHATDQSGEWMLSKSFEESCSSCHLNELLGDSRADAKGVAVLSVPELDVNSLINAGFNVGEWPRWADGEVTPIMAKLLDDDGELKALNPSLYDLSNSRKKEMESAVLLAWRVKELFYDIQVGGAKVLSERINDRYGGNLEASVLNQLVASLPKDTLINNQKEWFPNLMQEVAEYREGKIPMISKDENTAEPNSIQPPISRGTAKKEGVTSTGSAIHSNDNEKDLSDDEIDLSDDEIDLSDDEIDLSDDEINLSDDESVLVNVAGNEEWALGGGWYRDGSSIRYRPNNHADPFFKAWIDVSAKRIDVAQSSIFRELSDADGIGGCGKCHSTTKSGSDRSGFSGMHWQSFKPKNVEVDFNRFSHVSHFSLMSDDGCTSCHLLDENQVQNTTKSGGEHSSSFADMDRQTCTQCHQKGRAPDNCLTCHNYHVEPIGHPEDHISDSLREGLNE